MISLTGAEETADHSHKAVQNTWTKLHTTPSVSQVSEVILTHTPYGFFDQLKTILRLFPSWWFGCCLCLLFLLLLTNFTTFSKIKHSYTISSGNIRSNNKARIVEPTWLWIATYNLTLFCEIYVVLRKSSLVLKRSEIFYFIETFASCKILTTL